jgi:Tfp pilus assembly protein PilN
MNHFNYLGEARRLRLPTIATTFAIDNRVRGPLTALFATLLLSAAVSLAQLSRLHAAQRAYAAASAQLAASNTSVAAIKQLRARVAAKTQLTALVVDVRRISLLHANELAWIGNRLPPDTWLNALRYENGSYSLEGTSKRVGAVGSAILALRDNDLAPVPRLVSLHDVAGDVAAPVHYALRLEAHP